MRNHFDMDAAGLAALSICESLLLALVEHKHMSAKEISEVLDDVVATHREAADFATGAEAAMHRMVVGHVERIKAGGNTES
jgi:hypothetical protein